MENYSGGASETSFWGGWLFSEGWASPGRRNDLLTLEAEKDERACSIDQF